MSKVSKRVLTRKQTAHWTEPSQVISQGHIGGQQDHTTEDGVCHIQRIQQGQMVKGADCLRPLP